MTPRQTAPRAATYTASSTSTRAGFMSLAAAVTFAVLASLGNVADYQVEDVLMAQTAALPMAQAASEAMHKQG